VTTRAILLDIEGTTTPIAFVHDVLFTYAREHVRDYLAQHASELESDITQLREEHARDGDNPPPLSDELDSITTYINWLIDRDRKSTGLKSLQGKIWREGYEEGTLKSQVFDDVSPAFERWHSNGLRISIFSSGSALAQQLLFAHTEAGDLTTFISDYFDTTVGAKGDPESYSSIANNLNLSAEHILFISDVVAELEAAREAGMQTRLSIRPGNQPQNNPNRFRIIHTFDEV
jgi:enolase-phosphatase E1